MAAEYAYALNQAAQPLQTPYRQPAQQPEFPQKPQLKKVPRPHVDRRALERANNKKIAKVFAMVAFSIVLFGIFCNSFAAKTESRHTLDSINEKLSMQEDAHIVLENDLTKLVSAENIDKIAMQKLGLVKLTNADEDYVELESENRVIVSQVKD